MCADIFNEYAEYYDAIYADKDYITESKFVANALSSYVMKQPKEISILDIACGTAKHAIQLQEMGYKVDGADGSLQMINQAKNNLKKAKKNITLFNCAFQNLNCIHKKYDAIVALFASINYIREYNDFSKTMQNIKLLLNPKGCFLFDFWNGNAVLRNYSKNRKKVFEIDGLTISRSSQTTLDELTQIATINFRFEIDKVGQGKHQFEETHHIRYFFPQEMADLLEANGFQVLKKIPFLSDKLEVSSTDWNITYLVVPKLV